MNGSQTVEFENNSNGKNDEIDSEIVGSVRI